jgi:feruloyl esterase
MEAQRYPADYDGIIAGAPVNGRVHQMIWELWVAQAVHKDDASYMPPAEYRVLNDAALAQCDASDGAKDGLLTSPDRCRFDPATVQCKAGDDSSCLTPAQVGAAKKIYGPAKTRVPDERSFPRFSPGANWDGADWRGLSRCAKRSSSFNMSSLTIPSGTSARST